MQKAERVAAFLGCALLAMTRTRTGGGPLRMAVPPTWPGRRRTGVLVGVNGRRAMVSRLAQVEPTFGR
jgi:hypothetical protein